MLKQLLILFLFPFTAFSQTISVTSDGRLQANCPVCPPPVTKHDTLYKDTGRIVYRDTGSIRYVRIDTTIYRDTCKTPPIVTPPPPVQTGGSVFAITVTPVKDTLVRPGAGPYNWNNVPWDGTQALKIPKGATKALDWHYRFNWFDFETTQKGTYNFTKFDSYINAAIANGQKFIFDGVMPVCQGCSGGNVVNGSELGYPAWLHSEMSADPVINNRPIVKSGIWIPNWNSNIYLTAWENLTAAIASHVKEKGVGKYIKEITIRGIGNWGEWHMYPWYWEQKQTTPTVATLKRIVDSYIKYFPDHQLMIVSAAYDPGNASLMPPEFSYYALTARNIYGAIGWRRDNIGAKGTDNQLVNNPASWNGIALKTLIMDKWKTVPVSGEPLADNNEITENLTKPPYYDVMREVQLYHYSSIGNGNFGSQTAEAKKNITDGALASGYRISIDTGSTVTFSDSLRIKINWINTGVAPTYENWQVNYSIGSWSGKSSFDPKLFLPGGRTVIDSYALPVLAAGTYNLSIAVTDQTGIRKPLPLNSVIKCEIKR